MAHRLPKQKIVLFFIAFLLSVALFPPKSRGNASLDVPIDDPSYRYIDKLVAYGLVDRIIYGQRPYARTEVARITLEAEKNLSRVASKPKLESLAKKYIAYLRGRFPEDFKVYSKEASKKDYFYAQFFDQFWMEYAYLNSPPRMVPPDNGVGSIDAQYNSLITYRGGRIYGQDSNLLLQFDTNLQASPYFAAQVTPYFLLNFPNNGGDQQGAYIQRMYGKLGIKNIELTFGRAEQTFGQGLFGGPLLSDHARPLDMIRLTNTHPFYLPSLLRYLGPNQYTFFVSNLGPQQTFPNSYMVGFAASIEPLRFMEIGVNHTYILGGDGAPPFNWYIPITEFFWVNNPTTAEGINHSDHRLGLNLRFRIPPLRQTTIYVDWNFDDLDSNTFQKALIDAASYQVGLLIPRIDDAGNHQLRLEFRYDGPAWGRNGTFTSGYALDRNSLGDAMASNAYGFFLFYDWDLSEMDWIQFRAYLTLRENNIYAFATDPDGGLGPIVELDSRPSEKAGAVGVRWNRQWNDWIRSYFSFDYERVHNFNFNPGVDRNNFLFSANAVFSFGKTTRLPNQ